MGHSLETAMRKGVDPRGTEPMPFEVPAQAGGKEKTRQRPIKPAGYIACPVCTNQKVAVIPDGKHLHIKEHVVILKSRGRPQCQGTGQRLCEVGQGKHALNPQPESFVATCGGLHQEGENHHDR